MSALAQPIEVERADRAHSYCMGCGQPYEHGGQLWVCNDCGQVRVWGMKRPADDELKPLLICEDCGHPTRHAFLGVAI